MGTMEQDPLRTFCVDSYVMYGSSKWIKHKYDQYPHEFLHDIMLGMFEQRKVPKYQIRTNPAKYYQNKLLELEAALASSSDTDSSSDSNSDSDSSSESGSGSDPGEDSSSSSDSD